MSKANRGTTILFSTCVWDLGGPHYITHVSFVAPHETLNFSTTFCGFGTILRGYWARISRSCKSERDSLWRVNKATRLLQALLRLFPKFVTRHVVSYPLKFVHESCQGSS